ncbi:MAG: chemotaxis protein CheB [Victivallales bacterium]|nr:chemotaxis protein CheB [Victivallales bacterium]MCF7889363.1 chemotaxis protein CheB [Victivallales bacterium]
MDRKIRVLVVDDSPVKRKILDHILSSDKDIEVIDFAKNAEETLKSISKQRPDLITMDINIPGGINGFELTKLIMSRNPIPILVISAIRNEENKQEVSKAIMKSGALFFIDSPPGPWNVNFDKASKNIIRHVKLLSDPGKLRKRKTDIPVPDELPYNKKQKKKLILIGISTGGPALLQTIVSKLPEDFKTPIIIAQHISYGFDKLLQKQLDKVSRIPIKVIGKREPIIEGTVYLAPASKITEVMHNELVVIDPPKNFSGHLPSVAALFASVISHYGNNIVAIIMSGMGNDGVEQLKMLKDSGAVTIAQDEKTSIVYGMPKEAAKINAATYIMDPGMISDYLIKFDKEK